MRNINFYHLLLASLISLALLLIYFVTSPAEGCRPLLSIDFIGSLSCYFSKSSQGSLMAIYASFFGLMIVAYSALKNAVPFDEVLELDADEINLKNHYFKQFKDKVLAKKYKQEAFIIDHYEYVLSFIAYDFKREYLSEIYTQLNGIMIHFFEKIIELNKGDNYEQALNLIGSKVEELNALNQEFAILNKQEKEELRRLLEMGFLALHDDLPKKEINDIFKGWNVSQ